MRMDPTQPPVPSPPCDPDGDNGSSCLSMTYWQCAAERQQRPILRPTSLVFWHLWWSRGSTAISCVIICSPHPCTPSSELFLGCTGSAQAAMAQLSGPLQSGSFPLSRHGLVINTLYQSITAIDHSRCMGAEVLSQCTLAAPLAAAVNLRRSALHITPQRAHHGLQLLADGPAMCGNGFGKSTLTCSNKTSPRQRGVYAHDKPNHSSLRNMHGRIRNIKRQ